jgi:hypothetical protein
MWQINEAFEDIGRFRDKSTLFLNADKPINPYSITYPILWAGFLNNEKVMIKQIDSSSFHISDYDFIDFPDEYSYLQGAIVKAIDKYLKILD